MIYTGVFTTLIFFWFMLMYVLPEMHFMFSNSVIRWFQYGDRMYMTKKQILLTEQDLLVTKLLEDRETERQEIEKGHKINLLEWGTP